MDAKQMLLICLLSVMVVTQPAEAWHHGFDHNSDHEFAYHCGDELVELNDQINSAVPLMHEQKVCNFTDLSHIDCSYNATNLDQWQTACTGANGHACPYIATYVYVNGTIKVALEKFVCVPNACHTNERSTELAALALVAYATNSDDLVRITLDECSAHGDSEQAKQWLVQNWWVFVIVACVAVSLVVAVVLCCCCCGCMWCGGAIGCCYHHHCVRAHRCGRRRALDRMALEAQSRTGEESTQLAVVSEQQPQPQSTASSSGGYVYPILVARSAVPSATPSAPAPAPSSAASIPRPSHSSTMPPNAQPVSLV